MREDDFEKLMYETSTEVADFLRQKIKNIDEEYMLNGNEFSNLGLNAAANLTSRAILLVALSAAKGKKEEALEELTEQVFSIIKNTIKDNIENNEKIREKFYE